MVMPTVIIIEDDAAQSRLIRDVLTHEQSAIVLGSFTSGRLFFEWLDSQESPPIIDLLFLDMRLPGELGYELLPRIRERSGFDQTRALAVTANVLPADVKRAENAGFDGFLGKPIDPVKLPLYVAAVMRGSRVWKPL